MSATTIIAQARVERDRLVQFLTAIAEVRAAQMWAQQEGLSVAAEAIAVDLLIEAENRLIALVTDPAFSVYFQQIEQRLTEIVECSA